jgi:hypothetical protein
MNKVPSRGDAKAIEVNWLAVEMTNGEGRTTYSY